jgi:3-hydroxyacyl-[acyl-carrier-protein] dehydratase
MDHPSLAGHFPGSPIVPGTLILQRVIESLRQRHPGSEPREIVSAKFLRPLKPGEAFSIHFRERAGETDFECRVGGAPLSSGKLKLATPGDPV